MGQTHAEQERLQAELGGFEGDERRVAGAAQIADRFIFDGGDVDRREITGAQQARELDGVAAIVLDLVSRALGDQERRDDLAVEPLAGQVAMEPVATGAGLVHEHELGRLAAESADQFVDVGLPRPDGADELGRVGAVGFGVGDGDGILVDVQTDERRSRLVHG
jgi:hypothetical protein